MCADQSPWAVTNDLAYGFAAVNVMGQKEKDWCCSCYRLTFTSGQAKGKRMIVQATNTGSDLGENHFDIAVSYLLSLDLVYGLLMKMIGPWRRCRYVQRL